MLNNYFNDIKKIVLEEDGPPVLWERSLVKVEIISQDFVIIVVRIGRRVFNIKNNFVPKGRHYVDDIAVEIYEKLKEAKYVK